MSYQLFRMPTPTSTLDEGTQLGTFDTFEQALEARDDDAVALLATTDDRQVLLACHQIVDPDALPRVRCRPVTSALPRRIDSADPEADLVATRRWLSEIHSPVG